VARGGDDDLARTTVFYPELLGWTHHHSDMGPRGVYRHFQAAGKDVAGSYQLGPEISLFEAEAGGGM
jgi:predicted enzyme related to lactoylglutathione lyase